MADRPRLPHRSSGEKRTHLTGRAERLRGLVVPVAVVALIAASCGRSDDAAEDTSSEQDGGAPTTTAAPAGPGAGEFGDLGVVCGPAPAGETLEATDTGVTADSIQVSAISDPGFAGRPGLNQEIFDAAEAFTKWCNEAGGVNGRRIDLKERDAKLTEHQARMLEACEEGDFAIVGNGALFDDQGQVERLACGLPQVPAYQATAAAVGSDLTLQPMPTPTDTVALGDLLWLVEQHPDARSKIGMNYVSASATIAMVEDFNDAFDQLGWEVVYDEQHNPMGEVSWRGFAESMKSAGVRGLVWLAEPVNLAALRKAMDEIDYHPDFVRVNANHYDNLLLSEGGDAVNGTYIESGVYPFLDPELAERNLATQQYLDMMAKYDPEGKVANLGVMALSAWVLFAEAATECGAELTRDCVWEKANTVTEWSGGGLHAPQNLEGRERSDCFTIIEARDGKFVLPDIGANNGIYRCDPENVLKLEGVPDEGVRCENPAFADDPRPSNCAP